MESTAAEEPIIGSVATTTTVIDEAYEFSAPRWFDFLNGEETEEESLQAESWFETALTCAPSPWFPRIKARRSFKVEIMCNFNEEEEAEEEDEEEEMLEDKESLEPPLELSQGGKLLGVKKNRPKLKLTRPKEPQLMTSQRARSLRVKSSANIPKFKAWPLNKKILAAPDLPAPQRTTPHLPVFQEFHLETMARANRHAETSSIASTEISKQRNDRRPHLTAPKSPVLQTMLRARPANTKTTAELEQEELEKAPKFKAKPFNKKIFESKGEMGIICNNKKHITIPQEFHFATDERIVLTGR